MEAPRIPALKTSSPRFMENEASVSVIVAIRGDRDEQAPGGWSPCPWSSSVGSAGRAGLQ